MRLVDVHVKCPDCEARYVQTLLIDPERDDVQREAADIIPRCGACGSIDIVRRTGSEPHIVGTDAPTPENDPIGRFMLAPSPERCIYCGAAPQDAEHEPYCSAACAVIAESEG